MQSSYSPSELLELGSRITAKRILFRKAIKEDQAFKFVRAIYREMKALEKEFQQAVNGVPCLPAPMPVS